MKLSFWPVGRLRELYQYLCGQVLPCPCAICLQHTAKLVCDSCTSEYVRDYRPRCIHCAAPLLQTGVSCGECQTKGSEIDFVIAVCDYDAPQSQLITLLKFAGNFAIAQYIAEELFRCITMTSTVPLPDLIIPVPLSAERIRTRGYNQAWEIARLLGKYLKINTHSHLVTRTKNTQPQTTLDWDTRQSNLREAFNIPFEYRPQIAQRHVAVVDDVTTTGATLNQLAQLLKANGASKVSAFVFARTARH